MIGKKINQLATELAPVSTDLTIIGDPISGVSKKITLAQLGAIFSGAVSFYDDLASFPATGDINVIYCAKDTKKLYLWSGSAYVEVFPSQALLDTYQLRSEKGNANGYASLDSGGKVPVSQLPSSIMEYKGMWNAATNTPTLANGTGDTGDVYICNVAGTVNFGAGPLTFAVGDYVIYSGSIWQRSSGAVGTVTSVGASITGDSITISGSPISTSGTLALAFAGTSSQYINGAGNLTTFPSLTGYVPYTGATTNVNLGEFGITSGYYGFDLTPTNTPTTQGTMYWNADKESVDIIMNGVTGSVMQDSFYNVKNQTGSSIPKGTVVMASGTVGASGRILIAPFLADGTYDSKLCIGVTSEAIADGADGKVTAFGAIRQIDTSAFANGTILYASPSVAGAFTSTEPTNPNNIITLAIVVYSDTNNGEIFVRPTFVDNAADIAAALGYTPQAQLNGTGFVKASGTTISYDNSTYYLASNPNAYIPLTALSAGAGISYNNTTGVIASTITQYTDALARAAISLTTTGTSGAATYNSTTGVLNVPQYAPDLSGYVPTSRTLTINGTAYDLSANRSWSVGTVTSVGLSSATSGVTIGSTPITTSGTITLAIATASGSQNGLLSSTDWTTFNNKQNALTNPVTGTGTTNYLPKFTGTSTIGNSVIQEASSNIGIGISPTNKLDVYGTSGTIAQIKDGSTYAGIVIDAHSSSTPFSRYSSSGTGKFEIGYFSNKFYFNNNVGVNDTNAAMVITSTGNLGLGVTPSAWSGFTALQVQNSSLSTTGSDVFLNANCFFNGSNWRYIASAAASQYYQDAGSSIWRIAPSGTAGNAISFTQAMTLNASGNLSVGNTNDTYKLDVSGTGRFTGALTGTSATFSGDVIRTSSNVGNINEIAVVNTATSGASSSRVRIQTAFTGGTTLGDAITQYTDNNNFNWCTGSGVTTSRDYVIANHFTLGTSVVLRLAASTGAATFSSSVTAGGDLQTNGVLTIGNQFVSGNYCLQITPSTTTPIALQGILAGTGAANIVMQASGGNVVIGGTTAGTSLNTSLTVNNSSAGNYSGLIAMTADVQRGYYGGTSTGLEIGVAGSGILGIWTGGSERMRITSGGNVGIGVTSVNGLLSLKANKSNTPILRFQNQESGPDSAISTYTSSTQTYTLIGHNIYVDSSGNAPRFNTSYASCGIAFDEGDLRFLTGNSSGSASSKLTIASSGLATFGGDVKVKTLEVTNVGTDSTSSGVSTYMRITVNGNPYLIELHGTP